MCIAAIIPKKRNNFRDPVVSTFLQNNELMYRFSGVAVDDYEDVYVRKATAKELSDFFDSVYYGDENCSVKMKVVEVCAPIEDSQTKTFLLVLKPLSETYRYNRYSNSHVFVILTLDGFVPVYGKDTNDIHKKYATVTTL